jgi:hypothetical protein
MNRTILDAQHLGFTLPKKNEDLSAALSPGNTVALPGKHSP